jgi:predicted HTH transcriptional regulator
MGQIMEIVKRVCDTALQIIKVPALWTVRELIVVLRVTEKVIASRMPEKTENKEETVITKKPAEPLSGKKPSHRKQAKEKKAASATTTSGRKTVTEEVLGLIQSSPTGITVGELRKTMGIESKQISNACFRLLKQEKIEKKGRGVYSIRS